MLKKFINARSVIFTAAMVSLIGLGSAFADQGTFAKKHPRRAQVLRREQREKKKNDAAAASGKITQQQANQLNQEDNAIRAQEQADAAKHGGRITRAEQRQLNREENQVNRERRRDERMDAAHGTAPASNGAATSTTPSQ